MGKEAFRRLAVWVPDGSQGPHSADPIPATHNPSRTHKEAPTPGFHVLPRTSEAQLLAEGLHLLPARGPETTQALPAHRP